MRKTQLVIISFEDRKQLDTKECRQPLKTAKAKKTDWPLEPPEGTRLHFSPVRPILDVTAQETNKLIDKFF